MTGCCDSNPAQYERNRRFGHLVHVLVRSYTGAKLPSVGLCLNASKAESRLDMATMLLHVQFVWGRIGLSGPFARHSECGRHARSACPFLGILLQQSGRVKSSVDDLCTSRGVVLSRAVIPLRSVETQPFDWMICLVSSTSRPPRVVCVLWPNLSCRQAELAADHVFFLDKCQATCRGRCCLKKKKFSKCRGT